MSSVKCTARGHPSALKAQRRALFARDSSERTPNSSHMQSIDHEGMQGPGDGGADIYPSPQDLPMALSLGSEYKRSTTTACSEEVRIDHDPIRSISWKVGRRARWHEIKLKRDWSVWGCLCYLQARAARTSSRRCRTRRLVFHPLSGLDINMHWCGFEDCRRDTTSTCRAFGCF